MDAHAVRQRVVEHHSAVHVMDILVPYRATDSGHLDVGSLIVGVVDSAGVSLTVDPVPLLGWSRVFLLPLEITSVLLPVRGSYHHVHAIPRIRGHGRAIESALVICAHSLRDDPRVYADVAPIRGRRRVVDVLGPSLIESARGLLLIESYHLPDAFEV